MTTYGGLLGRDAERAVLRDALDQARDGKGELVLVAGEPGIGKTALVEDLAAWAASHGVPVCWGRCWEGGGAAPFWPWAQVLRAALADRDADDLVRLLGPGAADVGSLVPDVVGRLGPPRAGVAEGLDARVRLFDGVDTVLGAVASESGGILVVLEDVHAADEASLHLLRFLAHQLSQRPLVVVATLREAEVRASPRREALVSATARHGRTLRLAGLDEHHVAELLARGGAAGFGFSAAVAVHASTAGNPFLVQESARLLASGVDAGHLATGTEASALVRQRLDGLDPSVRRTVRMAALFGREFELATVARLTGRPADDLLDDLTEAAAAGVVAEAGLGRWAFGHGLLRDVLVDELDPDARPELHARAAEALVWRYGEDPEVAGQVAHHLVASGEPGLRGPNAVDGLRGPNAVDACARAADVAMARFAYEEAATWWELAAEMVGGRTPVDERRRYGMLLAVSDARLRHGALDQAKEASARAFKAARACGSVELLAEAAVRIAPWAMSDPVVITALDDALCDLPEEDSLLRARTMVAFVRVMSASSVDRLVLRQVNRDGLAMARRVAGGQDLWPILWQWHLNAFRDLDALDERVAVARELLALAEEIMNPERMVLARLWHATNLFELGEQAAVAEQAALVLEQAEALRQPFFVWSALTLHLRLALLRGDFDGAAALARRAHAVGGAIDEASGTERGAAGSATDTFAAATSSRGTSAHCDFANAEWEYDAYLCVIARYLGRFTELIERSRATLRRWPVYGLDCTRQVGMAFALAELGRHEEAAREMDELLAEGTAEQLFGIVTPYGRVDAPRLCCPAAAAEVSWILGDARRAEILYALLQPYAGRQVIVSEGESRGSCDRFLGQLAALLGRYDTADAHFQAAHLFHDRIGARPLGALGRRDHATMLIARNRPEDRLRARQLLVAALETFRAVGMDVYAERAHAELASLDAIAEADEWLSVRQEGEYWAFSYGGKEALVRGAKGVRYLAHLVAHPGEEVHAIDLVAGGATDLTWRAGDAGPALDAQAKAAYRRHLREAGSGEPGDGGGDAERRFIEAELARAVALGGRDRRAGSDAERARQSATRAIRGAIERIAIDHPALADHLRAAVRTGVYSSYRPEP